ncbi:MAG: hypothetical protein CMM59_20190 [Rhodospirillaceae bacterium]|nr:hypothetical protein [Rhodospirillaceae bacterium]
MTITVLTAEEVGLPAFDVDPTESADVFNLSSHERAREAIEFGLSIDDPGYNVFVLGEDRSGRMTATLSFLRQHCADRQPVHDWVYLNNFRNPTQPKPYRLPAGMGRTFRRRMEALVEAVSKNLTQAFASEGYLKDVREAGEIGQQGVTEGYETLRAAARESGLDIVQSPQGPVIVALGEDGEPLSAAQLPEETRAIVEATAESFAERLRELTRVAAEAEASVGAEIKELNRRVADHAVGAVFDRLIADLTEIEGLARWCVEMREDVLEHIEMFVGDPNTRTGGQAWAARRYAVNLLVDQSERDTQGVILEPNPTYQNLFGYIEYRSAEGGMETDFSMIRPGALHRANGGILVLRAEALAADPTVWFFLKAALRDRSIRLEELHRAGGVPVAGAPKPEEIPLDVKVVVVGAPKWYYTFFSADPEYQTYFKIKADIDADLESSPANAASYAGLIQASARRFGDLECDGAALHTLLGFAARTAANRRKLTARFELIEDIVVEAVRIAERDGNDTIGKAAVEDALAQRRRRNGRIEDRMQETIADGTVMIETAGDAVGQVNALVVRDFGDHAFGAPARVTAKASIGRHGVINIERDVALGGPIQQKGVMVLQGLLAGRFARTFPLSFDCSITFEQSYGGVEGDSASIAELVAILSELSGVPVHQSVAVTGSLNQHGRAQAVGGVHHKIEGFFRTCVESGGLTGEQGVVIPRVNADDIVLRDPVVEAVAAGKFRIMAVDTIEDAVDCMMAGAAGAPDPTGRYPAESIFGRVMAQLEAFNSALRERHGAV